MSNTHHFSLDLTRQDLIHGEATRYSVFSLGSIENKKILDLGCGEGKMFTYFLNNGAIVYASDCNFQTLLNARKSPVSCRDARCFLINAWSEMLPISSQSIDIVFSRSSLQYTDIDSCIVEC